MNKIRKTWIRINIERNLNKGFTPSYYEDLILRWKEKHGFISFSDPGKGILLRHDVDTNLDKAVRMAEREAGMGVNLNQVMFDHGYKPIVKSTYFILNTAKYWQSEELIPAVKYIQSLGHEIGWHNNAIAEHIKTGKNLTDCIVDPLMHLRENGIKISGSAAHGDGLCKEYGYINYNIFGFKTPGWDWYNIGGFDMSIFRLQYEAYHVPYDDYLADSYTGWDGDINKIRDWDKNGRYQVLIHPHVWRIY
jgi:hypothetical protein